ncbi:MAG: transposase [bacterium]
MRKARVTFDGAYHHITCRALEGKPILKEAFCKNYLIGLLKKYSKLRGIKLFAYCIMDNHYHLIIQNTSNKMDKFMRDVNGTFAAFYRSLDKSHGYVLQDRYYSKIIQNDQYLKIAIIYTLLNPYRAGIVDNAFDYQFSTINIYFKQKENDWVETRFVCDIFQNEDNFKLLLSSWIGKTMSCIKTKFGDIIGESDFVKTVEKKFDRREEKNVSEAPNMRINSKFRSKKDVIDEFLYVNEVTIKDLERNLILRNRLLVNLREKAGLSFKEINAIYPFKTLKYSSIISLYNNLKKNNKL